MDIYLDRANLKKFIENINSKNWQYIKGVLLKGCTLHYSLPFSEPCCLPANEGCKYKTDEQTFDSLYNDWVKEIQDNPIKIIDEQLDVKNLPIDENLSFVALLSNKYRCQDIRKSGNIIVGKEGEEFKVLSSLLIADKNGNVADSTTKTFFTPDFSYESGKTVYFGWEAISSNVTPCSDIIVVDPYFFDGKTSHSSDTFLNALLSCKKNLCCDVNLVIFYDNYKYDKSLREFKEKKNTKELINITKRINDYYNKKNPHINVTVVLPKTDYTHKLHDRFVITNYRLITSGHSFSAYFDDNNQMTAFGGKWLHISSNADSVIKKCTNSALKDLNKLIEERCTEEDSILGSGKCNLLNIEPILQKWYRRK